MIQENAAVKPSESIKSAPNMPKATKEFKTKKFETQHIAIVKSQTGFYSTKYNMGADIPQK